MLRTRVFTLEVRVEKSQRPPDEILAAARTRGLKLLTTGSPLVDVAETSRQHLGFAKAEIVAITHRGARYFVACVLNRRPKTWLA